MSSYHINCQRSDHRTVHYIFSHRNIVQVNFHTLQGFLLINSPHVLTRTREVFACAVAKEGWIAQGERGGRGQA